MMLTKMPELRIGDLTAKLPIIQGGMGVGISLSGLASAVANQGAIGVIAAVGMAMLRPHPGMSYREANVYELRQEIRKARMLSNGIIGVNIMMALTDYESLLLASVEEEVDLALLGAGLPLKIPRILTPERLKEGKTKTIPIVSSARAATIILKSWEKYNCSPDAFVVEGPLAGGHLGFKKAQLTDPDYTLEGIVPEVIKAVKPFEQRFGKNIPVIAAGGIYTGADILKFLELGAQGVQMATRFVPTHECDADIKFKEAYVKAKKDEMVIIESPVGLPGRAIQNGFLQDVSAGAKKPFKCPWKCLQTCNFRTTPYCIAKALANAQKGDLDNGFVFAGANAYRTERISSVQEVFDALINEYESATRLLYNDSPAAREELQVAFA